MRRFAPMFGIYTSSLHTPICTHYTHQYAHTTHTNMHTLHTQICTHYTHKYSHRICVCSDDVHTIYIHTRIHITIMRLMVICMVLHHIAWNKQRTLIFVHLHYIHEHAHHAHDGIGTTPHGQHHLWRCVLDTHMHAHPNHTHTHTRARTHTHTHLTGIASFSKISTAQEPHLCPYRSRRKGRANKNHTYTHTHTHLTGIASFSKISTA